jgi:hypothetical protein
LSRSKRDSNGRRLYFSPGDECRRIASSFLNGDTSGEKWKTALLVL